MATYLTPTDTAEILHRHADRCLNMSLVLGRYIPQEVINKEDVPNERNLKWSAKWLPPLVKRFDDDKVETLQSSVYARWQSMTSSANAISWNMPLLTRLIVGLGGKGALEIGITLDKVTGLPFIPGSALKGACRNYALFMLAEKYSVPVEAQAFKDFDEKLMAGDYDSEETAWLYHHAFGTQENAGDLIFFDAVVSKMVEGKSLFTLDVMTPHFVQYYSNDGKKPPADNDSPNPVNFITVTHGTTFAFAIGLRHGKATADGAAIQTKAVEWLTTALQDFGIGSKTAAGYGAFKAPTQK